MAEAEAGATCFRTGQECPRTRSKQEGGGQWDSRFQEVARHNHFDFKYLELDRLRPTGKFM